MSDRDARYNEPLSDKELEGLCGINSDYPNDLPCRAARELRRRREAESDAWTDIYSDRNHPDVRRFPVPGGWLYVVQIIAGDSLGNIIADGWHPPVFVPDPTRTLVDMTPEERVRVIDEIDRRFCLHCGTLKKGGRQCPCTNDE